MKRTIVLISLLAACGGGSNAKECDANTDCLQGGVDGICIVSSESAARFCAYPDAVCASGNRWGVGAGDGLADECVAPAGPGEKVTLTVKLEGGGSGRVTSEPPGIDCPGTCESEFDQGAVVTLAVLPEGNSAFVEWSSGCSGWEACSVTLGSSAAGVGARFELRGSTIAASLLSEFQSDAAYGLTSDNEGKVYFGGMISAEYFGARGAMLLGSIGLTAPAPDWVAKFKDEGEYQSGSSIEAVALALDGGVVVAGRVFRLVVDGQPIDSANGGDQFLAKFDQTGHLEWIRQFDPGGASDLVSSRLGLAVDPSGNIFHSLPITTSFNFAGKTITGTQRDTAILKFDSLGNPLDAVALGDEDGNVMSKALALDSKGDVYLVGSFDGAVAFRAGINKTATDRDAFLVKLGNDLEFGWVQTFSSAELEGREEMTSLSLDASDNVYVLGRFATTVNLGGLDLQSSGMQDLFAASFQSNGTHRWSRAMGGPMDDEPQTLCAAPTGDVAVTGSAGASFQIDAHPVAGQGAFLVSLNKASGTSTWSRSLHGGEEGDTETFAMQCTERSLILAGAQYRKVTHGTITLEADGYGDAILHSVVP